MIWCLGILGVGCPTLGNPVAEGNPTQLIKGVVPYFAGSRCSGINNPDLSGFLVSEGCKQGETTQVFKDTIEVELPKEYYYWFIVHPKLTQEFPTYINPKTGNPADPPTGAFWRDYIFNFPDTAEYTVISENGQDTIPAGWVSPILRDQFTGVSTLWNHKKNTTDDNGAIGVITEWVKKVMVFNTPPTRPIQPIQVFHYHQGRCSEHCYLTASATRACLIPAVVTIAYRNNHKWNEFYERHWYQLEPVNTMINDSATYDNWWQLAAAFDWRGDGYIWTVSERYSPCCTLLVTVKDANGNPVDGARIKIDSEGWVGWGATCGWTDRDGKCKFLLGDNRSYFSLAVESNVGNYPTTTVITNSQAGVLYTYNVNLGGTLPHLSPAQDSLPPGPLNNYKFEYSLESPVEILHGNNIDDNNKFSEPIYPGHLTSFICDQEQFNLYTSGSSFKAFQFVSDTECIDSNFVIPTDTQWYIVISNEEVSVLTRIALVTVRLYEQGASGWELIDSVNVNVRIPAGERCYVYFDNISSSLVAVLPYENLISVALSAIEYAPDWLKWELRENFAQMDSTHQEIYANIILNAVDPFVDEIAFQVAHIAPEVLQDTSIYTQLLTKNVSQLYTADSSLQYVEVVNHGSAAVGGDYYSTVRYRVVGVEEKPVPSTGSGLKLFPTPFTRVVQINY